MKILVIEDDQRVSDLIQRGLEEQGYGVTTAFDGEMGLRLVSGHDYDLIIMDLVLPKVNGLDLCRAIRTTRPGTPILMLTALGTTDDKVEGFNAGADDYLVKPFDFRELHVRIRALTKRLTGPNTVQGGSGNGNGFILSLADLVMNLHTKTVSRGGTEIRLTPKEFKLLEYMLRNTGRVVSRVEIADNVWATTFDTGTNFIDVYINYLRKKIDRDYTVKLIHTRPGMGFIMKEDSPHDDPQ